MAGAQIHRRQSSRSPCPAALLTTTTITTSPFQLLCNLDFDGSDLIQYSASSLSACINICITNTSCRGVSFESTSAHGLRNCYLKTLPLIPVTRTFPIDSAVALPLDVRDECASLSDEVVAASVRFRTYCGRDYPQNDAGDWIHAQSMSECLEACAAKKMACAGVSYEAAMLHGKGYWNCYLKTAVGLGGLRETGFKIDSAFVVDPAGGNVSAAVSSVGTSQTSVWIQTLTLGSAATQTGSAPGGGKTGMSGGSIVGAVVGSVAGLVVIIVLCVVLLKRRRYSAPVEYAPGSTEYYGYENYQGGTAEIPGFAGKSVVRQELHGEPSERRELAG